MSTVKDIIVAANNKKGLLRIKCKSNNRSNLSISGTPEGFKLFANMLIAQADGNGGFGQSGECGCTIENSDGNISFLTTDSVKSINFHCHDDYQEIVQSSLEPIA